MTPSPLGRRGRTVCATMNGRASGEDLLWRALGMDGLAAGSRRIGIVNRGIVVGGAPGKLTSAGAKHHRVA